MLKPEAPNAPINTYNGGPPPQSAPGKIVFLQTTEGGRGGGDGVTRRLQTPNTSTGFNGAGGGQVSVGQ